MGTKYTWKDKIAGLPKDPRKIEYAAVFTLDRSNERLFLTLPSARAVCSRIPAINIHTFVCHQVWRWHILYRICKSYRVLYLKHDTFSSSGSTCCLYTSKQCLIYHTRRRTATACERNSRSSLSSRRCFPKMTNSKRRLIYKPSRFVGMGSLQEVVQTREYSSMLPAFNF